MFLPRTVILAQLESSCITVTQLRKKGRGKEEENTEIGNFNPRYIPSSCDEQLANNRSCCWNKALLLSGAWLDEHSYLTQKMCWFQEISSLRGGRLVHPSSWVSCHGCLTSEPYGRSLSVPSACVHLPSFKGACQAVVLILYAMSAGRIPPCIHVPCRGEVAVVHYHSYALPALWLSRKSYPNRSGWRLWWHQGPPRLLNTRKLLLPQEPWDKNS